MSAEEDYTPDWSENKNWTEYDWEMAMRQSDRFASKYFKLLDQYGELPGSDEIILKKMGGITSPLMEENDYYIEFDLDDLQEIEYARVIHMDADGFPLKSLDHLFLLRMAEGTRVAAPQGYWFKKQGVGVGWQRGCLGKMAHKSLEKDFYSMFQTQNNTKRNSSIKILETVENLSYLCENVNDQILKKL